MHLQTPFHLLHLALGLRKLTYRGNLWPLASDGAHPAGSLAGAGSGEGQWRGASPWAPEWRPGRPESFSCSHSLCQGILSNMTFSLLESAICPLFLVPSGLPQHTHTVTSSRTLHFPLELHLYLYVYDFPFPFIPILQISMLLPHVLLPLGLFFETQEGPPEMCEGSSDQAKMSRARSSRTDPRGQLSNYSIPFLWPPQELLFLRDDPLVVWLFILWLYFPPSECI